MDDPPFTLTDGKRTARGKSGHPADGLVVEAGAHTAGEAASLTSRFPPPVCLAPWLVWPSSADGTESEAALRRGLDVGYVHSDETPSASHAYHLRLLETMACGARQGEPGGDIQWL